MDASNLAIVTLSVFVAMFASFTALNLSGRLIVAGANTRFWWLLAAGCALGSGTWAMHFLGMLSMNMLASYDISLTFLSLLLPIAASCIGLQIVSRSTRDRALLGGGCLVGAGIVAMHYLGMAAMRVPGMAVRYDARFVTASVVIAFAAASAALWLAFRTRNTVQRGLAAIVMGLAISGMHYVAMAGATFAAVPRAPVVTTLIQPTILAILVIVVAIALQLLALLTAYFDRALSRSTARDAAALIASEQRYRSLIESTSDMIGIVDDTGAFTYENSSAWNVLGYQSEDLIGHHPTEFVPADSVAATKRFFRKILTRPGLPSSTELALLSKTGERRSFEVVGTNYLDVPAIGGVVLNLRDITERKRMIAQLQMLSETDLLTNALNRRGFIRAAEREFERVRRDAEMISLVMMDVDHFKAVNDTYGHAAGDIVLAKVAECCRSLLRDCDLFGRVGGEEFAILLVDAHRSAAQNVVTRMAQSIAAATIASAKGSISVTASFGIAIVDPLDLDLDGALNLADGALYEAKHAGRNCVKMAV